MERPGTDAEGCVCLYTVGLTAPMDCDWSRIYLYVANKTHARHKGGQVPENIGLETFDDHQIGEPKKPKDWLC